MAHMQHRPGTQVQPHERCLPTRWACCIALPGFYSRVGAQCCLPGFSKECVRDIAAVSNQRIVQMEVQVTSVFSHVPHMQQADRLREGVCGRGVIRRGERLLLFRYSTTAKAQV